MKKISIIDRDDNKEYWKDDYMAIPMYFRKINPMKQENNTCIYNTDDGFLGQTQYPRIIAHIPRDEVPLISWRFFIRLTITMITVSNEVFLGKQSKVWQHALNRVYVQKSILLYCFE